MVGSPVPLALEEELEVGLERVLGSVVLMASLVSVELAT